MATYSESYEFEFPKQTDAEELANTLTHGTGMVLSLAGAIAVLVIATQHGCTVSQWIASLIYGASLVAVYAASTLSHAIQEPRNKQLFRVLDQAVIYCLIAGTYTPFIVAYMPSDERKWLLLVVVWCLAGVGFFSKALLKHRIEAVAVVNYILLGWLPAAAMFQRIPTDCLWWMFAGGMLYTLGAIFLTLDQRVPFFHTVWHGFVLLASGCHFYAVVQFTLA